MTSSRASRVSRLQLRHHRPRPGAFQLHHHQRHRQRTCHGCRSLLSLFCLCRPLLPQCQFHRLRILYGFLAPTKTLTHRTVSQASNPTHQQPFPVQHSSRVRDMFAAGVDQSPTHSPSLVRCARHLHRACEICITPDRTPPARTRSDHGAIERAPVAQGWIVSGFSEGAGVGSGLASPGLGGSLLRRGIYPLPDDVRGGKNTQLAAELIPRFLRLSALVALELGREVGTTTTSAEEALVPTSEWYLLLAGLLTCAVLEGYLTAGWTGLAPVQVLLGVGLGSAVNPEASPLTTSDEYDEFEPDDMPDLPNAVSVLFPSWSGPRYDTAGGASGGRNYTGSGRRRQGSDSRVVGEGWAEFSHEMGQRATRVCTNCSAWRFAVIFLAYPLDRGTLMGLLITGRSSIL
jgi:hypothetical protein